MHRRVRVPVEHRLLGLDRRSFPPALVVLAVFVVATVVIPRVDRSVDFDDPVRAGDQLRVAEGVVFTPEVGWNVRQGFRSAGGGAAVSSGPAVLEHAGVTLEVRTDSFDGSPAELIRQIEKVTTSTSDPTFQVDDDPTSITTTDGLVGVSQGYSSIRSDGVIAAFVVDGTGVEVTAYGPSAQMRAASDAVRSMVLSIRRTTPQEAA